MAIFIDIQVTFVECFQGGVILSNVRFLKKKTIQTGKTGFHNDCVMYEVVYSPQLHILLNDYISLQMEAIEKNVFCTIFKFLFTIYTIFYRGFRLSQSVLFNYYGQLHLLMLFHSDIQIKT